MPFRVRLLTACGSGLRPTAVLKWSARSTGIGHACPRRRLRVSPAWLNSRLPGETDQVTLQKIVFEPVQ